MATGRQAARAVDAYLQGSMLDGDERVVGSAPLAEKIFPVRLEKLEPFELPRFTAEEALESFKEVDLPAAPRDLETDTRRCMRCGYIEVDHQLCLGRGICRQLCPAGDVLTMGSPLKGGEA